MLILTKSISPHEGNLRAERFRSSGEPLFRVPCWDFRCYMCTRKKRARCDTVSFLRNHESRTKQIMYLKWALANFQNMSIYYPSGKYKLSIRSFSGYHYCYKIIFLHIILCPSKKCFVHDNVHKVFSALNLIIIFMKAFICIRNL